MSEAIRPKLTLDVIVQLRALTPARVGLGLTGGSQLTRDVLAFQSAHAQARDAVHARMDRSSVSAAVRDALGHRHPVPILLVHSAARDRAEYLRRPDLGRRLDEASRSALSSLPVRASHISLVVADGLSALAVERHVPPLLEELLPLVSHLQLAPVCIAEQARVAVGDEIGEILSSQMAVVLIGERPGLSSPDSLGAYLTWGPRLGRTDAERNCISNIRAEGLSYREAARQIASCIAAAQQHGLTGVALGKITAQLPAGAWESEKP